MSLRQKLWRYLTLFSVVALFLTGCGDPNLSTLTPQGEVAEKQLWLIQLSFYVMILVILVVMIIYTYVLIKFRRKPGQENYIPKQVEGSHKLEVTWTVIPIILLIILAIPTTIMSFELEKPLPEGESLKVKVTGHQFWWEFEYPELGIVTAQDLHIPVGKWVEFEITSKDVIHSFWVPALGGKVDANPGQVTRLKLKADNAGVFVGECAELCGSSHALMYFNVIAEEPGQFDQWIASMTNTPATPNTALAQEGEALYKEAGCIGCHAISGKGTTGGVGPNLANFGDRELVAGVHENTKENVKAWLKDPKSVKPGNLMPNLGLTDEQVEALAEYLSQLKAQ